MTHCSRSSRYLSTVMPNSSKHGSRGTTSSFAQNRVLILDANGRNFWVAAERAELAHSALQTQQEEAFADVLRGWLESSGPLTVTELVEKFGVAREVVEAALIRLETEGQLLRGRFRALRQAQGDTEEEWCNRRVLARIHRRTIGQLRREIEPVTAAEYHRFLYRWQHVAPASRLHGVDGTLQVIRQLEGYEIPAAAWEAQILPSRIASYRSEYLDKLCYSGEVMWGRLAPHPALSANESETARRIRPTKLAPISLFTREDADELIVRNDVGTTGLSHAAREVLDEIRLRGAPFFMEIVRGSKRLPAEVEEALWQLVAAGLVTADGFDALRSLIDAKRRLGEKGLRARPRSSSGRGPYFRPKRKASTGKSSRGVCLRVGASSFVTSSRAKVWLRRGGSCCGRCAAWKRAARFAAAASCPDSSASSSRYLKQSKRCARRGEAAKRPACLP